MTGYKVIEVNPNGKLKYAVGTDFEYWTHTLTGSKREAAKMAKEINELDMAGKVRCPNRDCGKIHSVTKKPDKFGRVMMKCDDCGKPFGASLKFYQPSTGEDTMKKKSTSTTGKTRTTRSTTKKAAAKAPTKRAATKSTTKKAAAPRASRGPSQIDKLRKLFSAKGKAFSIDQVAKALGTDTRNAAVAISIAKNPNRTKDPIKLERDTKTKKYKRVA